MSVRFIIAACGHSEISKLNCIIDCFNNSPVRFPELVHVVFPRHFACYDLMASWSRQSFTAEVCAKNLTLVTHGSASLATLAVSTLKVPRNLIGHSIKCRQVTKTESLTAKETLQLKKNGCFVIHIVSAHWNHTVPCMFVAWKKIERID